MFKTFEELKDLCYYFYHANELPIYLVQQETQLIHYPAIPSDIDPLPIHLRELLSSAEAISYLVTNEFLYYGKITVADTPYTLIIGPSSSTLSSREVIHTIMRDASIHAKKEREFTEFFQQIPVLSFSHFLNILCYVYFILYKKTISMGKLADIEHHTYEMPVSKIHAANYFIAKEEQLLHNTYKFEEQYLSYIEKGEVDALKNMMMSAHTLRTGIVADNNIRQVKNLFIASTTLATRAAVKGGLDIETAYQLSDTSIREMEKLTDHTSINELQFQTILDFARRVRETIIPEGISPVIYDCVQYISTHTNQPLSANQVAEQAGLSRSYLSKKFKEEMGFDLSSFMMRCKLEEAKSLLSFTDKTISEISSYLCFSSQSYFQNVFKKKYGITPKEFREKKSNNK